MTISSWLVYWVTRLDGIRCVLLGLLIAVAVVSFSVLLFGYISADTEFDREEKARMLAKCAARTRFCARCVLPCFLFLLVAHALIPTTREMAAILVIPAVASNEDMQGVASELPQLAREWIEELRPEKGGE